MKDLDLKNKVLDEIMSMMDEKEGDNLKKKSPKFMAMSVEVKKPDVMEMKEEKKEEMDEMEDLDPEMIKELIKKLQE